MKQSLRESRLCPRILAMVFVLVSAGLGGSGASEGQRGGPVLIGALSESWGPTPAIVGLRDGLAALGYRENEHFMIGVRFTQGNPAELATAARQLVERGAGILVTGGGGATEAKAAQMATDRIPIVFMTGSDPVGLGLVPSLARPAVTSRGLPISTSSWRRSAWRSSGSSCQI